MEGDIVAITHVLVFPPNESLKSLVSLLSLNKIQKQNSWVLLSDVKPDLKIPPKDDLLPVRNMARVLNKRVNDTAKSKQTLVDLSSFPGSSLQQPLSNYPPPLAL